nr:uncharacterized protein LOC113695478 [Coffea arabica]
MVIMMSGMAGNQYENQLPPLVEAPPVVVSLPGSAVDDILGEQGIMTLRGGWKGSAEAASMLVFLLFPSQQKPSQKQRRQSPQLRRKQRSDGRWRRTAHKEFTCRDNTL